MKKFLYINRRAPHGTIYAQEGLEVALIGAAFDQPVAIAYIDDGVFQLKQGQDAAAIGSKNFSATLGALGDFEVGAVYVEQESLQVRGLQKQDLVSILGEDEDGNERSLIRIVSSYQLRTIIEQSDVVLNF